MLGVLIRINERREFGKDTNRMNRCFVGVVRDKLHCGGRYRVCVIEPEHQQELLSLQGRLISATDRETIW